MKRIALLLVFALSAAAVMQAQSRGLSREP